ncbi:MAG: nitrate reductase associated protein [Polyangiaceae bacterium]
MYKRFAFEGDIHDSLECVPLSVRRKLDLAALKISLDGWQRLSRPERLALCHLPVDSAHEIVIYREILSAFCARAAVPLKPLDDATPSRPWNSPAVPPSLAARLTELGGALADAAWRLLDEESRYALFKLADPKRDPEKIRALLVELALLPGPAPVIRTDVVVCEPQRAVGTTDSPEPA